MLQTVKQLLSSRKPYNPKKLIIDLSEAKLSALSSEGRSPQFYYDLYCSDSAVVAAAAKTVSKILGCRVVDLRASTEDIAGVSNCYLLHQNVESTKILEVLPIDASLPISSPSLDQTVRTRQLSTYKSNVMVVFQFLGIKEGDKPIKAVAVNIGTKETTIFLHKKDAAKVHYIIERLGREVDVCNEPILEPGLLDTILGETLKPFAKQAEFHRLGIAPSRGIMLSGDPGNGKTLMTRFLQTYARSKFNIKAHIINHASIMKAIGEGTVDHMFNFEGIIILDDINVELFDRQANPNAAGALLSAMDGPTYDPDMGISVKIFTTNEEPDRIDKAFLRPGRIDRVFRFEKPKLAQRVQLVETWPDEALELLGNPEIIGKKTKGLSFAEIDALKNHALRLKIIDDIEIGIDQCIDQLTIMREDKNQFTYDSGNKDNMGFAPVAPADDEDWPGELTENPGRVRRKLL